MWFSFIKVFHFVGCLFSSVTTAHTECWVKTSENKNVRIWRISCFSSRTQTLERSRATNTITHSQNRRKCHAFHTRTFDVCLKHIRFVNSMRAQGRRCSNVCKTVFLNRILAAIIVGKYYLIAFHRAIDNLLFVSTAFTVSQFNEKLVHAEQIDIITQKPAPDLMSFSLIMKPRNLFWLRNKNKHDLFFFFFISLVPSFLPLALNRSVRYFFSFFSICVCSFLAQFYQINRWILYIQLGRSCLSVSD